MIDQYQSFVALPNAETVTDFIAITLSRDRRDFLVKGMDGEPVFLLHDASPVQYVLGRKLRYISAEFHTTCRVQTGTVVIDDQFAMVSCDATSPELHELFIRCVGAAIESLPTQCGTKDLESCVHALLDLFRVFSESATRELSGLWAELWVISKSNNVARAMEVWRDNAFERFDFSWENTVIEVKSTVRSTRAHEFALEQLSTPVDGRGYVVSLMLQPLTGGVSILELVEEIAAVLTTHSNLKNKLWRGVATALGKDFADKLDKRFDPSFTERHLVVYNMNDVPKVEQTNDLRISAVRFVVDLSTVNSSQNGTPLSNLELIFQMTKTPA